MQQFGVYHVQLYALVNVSTSGGEASTIDDDSWSSWYGRGELRSRCAMGLFLGLYPIPSIAASTPICYLLPLNR